MKMRFILPLTVIMVLMLVSFVAADYEPQKYLRDVNCDPVDVGIRALEDCNIAGNIEAPEGKYVNADLPAFYDENKILAQRDCYQRSNVRICNWDADGTGDFKNVEIAGQWITYKDNAKLQQCLNIVEEYCGTFNTVKQIQMKTETGYIDKDRDYKATVEGGGIPSSDAGDDESDEVATPEEDTGAVDTTADAADETSTTTPAADKGSSTWIWWIVIIVIILLIIWWAVAGSKKGGAKSTEHKEAKKESKPMPKAKSKKR